MVRYSDELLDEIKRQNDIVDVISQYVVLKRKGRNYFGLCPFHNEKSPSFSVSPDKQIFKCFGCGQGGNVFHFIMKAENISFFESVQILAERAKIDLPNSYSAEDEKRAKQKDEVYKINKLAAEFFHQTLYKPTSKQAQEYIKKRKLDNNTLKAFLIGYAPSNNELYSYLKQQGFSEQSMLASSLIGRSQQGNYYDKFRNRLMFPIQDVRNRVIAFGGRVLIPEEERKNIEIKTGRPHPKYINSPENIVYSKGRNLFGLNVAKKGINGMLDKILIVEGYMDVISLHQRGITNVVASLGTALTDNQGRLLRKNAEQVILGYDADGAGQNAIVRGMDILKSMGVDIRVLQINGAKDPDEFVVKYGADRFKKYMDNAISVVEYKVKTFLKNLNLDNTNDKIKFLNQIAKTLSDVDNTMEREVYVDKISQTYNISKEAIYAEINKLIYKNTGNPKIIESNIPRRKAEIPEKKIDDKTFEREKMLIYLLINYPKESYERLSKIINPELILDETNKNIVETIYKKYQDGQDAENITDWFEDDSIINYISGIIIDDLEIGDIEKAIDDLEKSYMRESKIHRRNTILKMLEAKGEMSKEEQSELVKELNNIIIELAKMK